MNFIKLETQKLDIGAINDLVAHESCGAISMFVGTTRDNFEDKKVLSLEYEAFEPMAIKTMTTICNELRTNWPDIKNIAIYHRLGDVPVKEASVVIAISSPHRETSLLGVQFAIDTLKKSVPIWKKEKYEGDESAWKENKESGNGQSPGRKNRFKLNFDCCTVEAVPVLKSLVQITADDNEVSRRINCFVEKKREEIDSRNISCFMEKRDTKQPSEEATCARVTSTVFKQKDKNSHLRVHRVNNAEGPQIKPDYASALNKLMGNATTPSKVKVKQEPGEHEQHTLPHGLEQRIENVENFLGDINKPVPRNLYDRVKYIEDRLLYLESISPEYYHFLTEQPRSDIIKRKKRTTYTIEELDKYIEDVKKSMV